MPSFEIQLQRSGSPARHASSRGAPLADLPLSLSDTLDVVVEGERLCAATRADHAACLVRDLAAAALQLAEARTSKVLVPFYDTPWELCLTRGEGTLLASLYRAGPSPEVRALDVAVPLLALSAQVRAAVEGLHGAVDHGFVEELGALTARLEGASRQPLTPAPQGPATMIRWRSRARGAVGLHFQAVVPGASEGGRAEAARADLHALLIRGRVGLPVRGQELSLSPGFVVLQIERLVALCRPILEAWAARRALHLRVNVGGATLGVRLGTDERLALTVHRPAEGTVTVPALDPRELAEAVLEGALALCSALVRCNRPLARNLRLRALRAEARSLRRWLKDLGRHDAKVNDDPAAYRALAVLSGERPAPELDLGAATKLRYSSRWTAEIEGLDLAGTLLCGDKLVVPGARELHALDRVTGASVWSLALPRAATTLAGEAILRLSSRGEVELREVSTGEVTWSARVTPRVGAPALAFAVTAPGLPRIVVLAEGERRLVALDLRTGEARWTYTARHGGTFRMRRVGRLLVVVSGDSTVTAIDLTSGELVWRFSDRVVFTAAPLVYRDQVIALAGDGGRGPARVYALGAYTGALLWSAEADAPACCAPSATGDTVAVALATREGVELAGWDVGTGAARFRTAVGAVAVGWGARPATIAFDDVFVTNLPTGRVAAVGAAGGEVRWARSLGAPLADDVPRRLDPQLRAGALFVPQRALAVLRPRDGAVLAEVDACDLVPDLVRVDEQCALYVAEESGHLGCYELGTRLRVVRPV